MDLDPSLRDGMPPQEDLRRYSRDYYVGGSTSKTAPRGKNSNTSHPKHPQSQSPAPNPHQLTNGHHSLPSATQQVTKNGQVRCAALQVHDKTPCMSGGGDEESQLHLPPSEASTLNPQHSSSSSSSTIAAFHGMGDTTVASEGEPGRFHSAIIDRFNKDRTPSPNSSGNQRSKGGVRSSSRSSFRANQFTPSTQSQNSPSNKVEQAISQGSSTTEASPLSSLVTPLLPESPGIGELEGAVMRHSVTRLSFRSRQATREFSLNPLFEDEAKAQGNDSVQAQHPTRARYSLTSSHASEPSSDYYSSYESLPYLSSFSREGSLRLPKPQVTEEVFETISDTGGSLRLQRKNKPPLKSWGSFKHKKSMMF